MAFDWSDWTLWSSAHDAAPKVHLTVPPAYFFKLPPSDFPQILPPPSDHPTLAHPFTIPVGLYNAALSPNVPILAALGYATVVSGLNSVNKSRKYKPWAFSKTRFFKIMVITHNIILAVYSAWTFVGMVNTLKTSVYPPWEELGLAGTVDSLCKMHGPRGPGSAAVYGESTSVWSITNRFVHLAADGLTPESTDVGRIWNQGLAFYGWLFYLSKFYEVIDTLIILAKGKKSSFLQTFHHAGAMLCMWAGMRYMSPPIWMFVLVNSFIHSIMYTFYLCSAIGVKVPVWFKRTLTTLQITQFVVGASYAFAHLFVKYQVPVSVPYVHHLGRVASSAISTASAVATDDWQALLKKVALRAAGREGLAQNVYDHTGHAFGVDAVNAAKDWISREETRYRDELQWTNCLDTSGQAFAVMLNIVYLMPLTWLFANFFIQSYLRRVERRRSSTASQKAQLARESVSDAARRSGRRLSQAFENPQDGVEESGDDITIVDGEEIKRKVNNVASKVKKEAKGTASTAKEEINKGVTSVKRESSKILSQTEKRTEETTSEVRSSSSQAASKIESDTSSVVEDAKQGIANTLDTVKAQADSLKAKAQDQYGDYVKEGDEKTKAAISSLVTGTDEEEPASDGPAKESSGETSESRGTDAYENGGTTASQAPKSGEEKDTDQEKEELSPKEQVQHQDSSVERKAEVSTGDAKEDDSPTKQSSKQDIVRETSSPSKKSRKERRAEQNSRLESSKREDVANQKAGSKGFSGQETLAKAASTAKDTAASAVEQVKDAVEDPSSELNQTVDKVKDGAKEAQETISQTLQSSGGKDAGDAHDYEDQKESWIHVSEKDKDSKANASGSKETEDGKRPASPEWFEKLTSGIDSPSKTRDEAEQDEKEKKQEDKILDDSEELRDHVIDETTEETHSSTKDQGGANGGSGGVSKEEEDKIIDESEPVRDEVKDTDTEGDTTKEESEADLFTTSTTSNPTPSSPMSQSQSVTTSISNQSPSTTTPESSPRKWHAKRRGLSPVV